MMHNLFRQNKFERFLWFSVCVQDLNIIEPKKMVNLAKRLNATVIHFPATGSSIPDTVKAFYHSKILPQPSWLQGRNLLSELLEIAHCENIKVVAYFNGHWYPQEFFKKHPWVQMTSSGEEFSLGYAYGGGSAPCVNHPEFQTYTRDVLTEIASDYPVDGIFLDGPAYFMNTCYCRYCVDRFRQMYGEQLPRETDWNSLSWHNFINFRKKSLSEFLNRIHKKVKDIRDIPVYKNGAVLTTTWFNCLDVEEFREDTDLLGSEHFVFYIEPLQVPIWGAGAVAKYQRSLGQETKPSVVFLCYGHKKWDYYPLPPEEMKLLIAETISNLSYPFVTIDDYQLVNDEHNMDAIGEMFTLIAKNEEYFIQAQPYAEIALLWSAHTANFYTRATIHGAAGTHHYEIKSEKEYLSEFRGMYDIVSQLQIPFTVVGELNLTLEELSKYKTLILPNVASLSEEQVKVIGEYVHNGGNLLCTGETSLYDENGKVRDNFSLSKVLGIDIVEDGGDRYRRSSGIDYQRVVDEQSFLNGFKNKLIPLPLFNVKTRVREGYNVHTLMLETMPHRYAPLPKVSPYPGLISGNYGRGKVIYFSGNVGELYYRYRVLHIRELLREILSWMGLPEIVHLRPSPLPVHLNVSQGDSFYLLHLVNWATRAWSRPVDKVLPLQRVEILFNAVAARKVVDLNKGQDIPFEKDNKWIKFKIDLNDVYTLIAVKV